MSPGNRLWLDSLGCRYRIIAKFTAKPALRSPAALLCGCEFAPPRAPLRNEHAGPPRPAGQITNGDQSELLSPFDFLGESKRDGSHFSYIAHVAVSLFFA